MSEFPETSKPTEDEINRVVDYLRVQECALGHHAPSNRIATMADHLGFYFCECGAVRWVVDGA